MNDLRKIINLIAETTAGATSSGSVAAAPQALESEVNKREPGATEKPAQDSGTPPKPEVLEFGNWKNSALVTGKDIKDQRKSSGKIVASIYGSGSSAPVKRSGETESTKPQAKKTVKESQRLSVELAEQDLILNPHSLGKKTRGLLRPEAIRTDHEVEMALGDLYQAGKNASMIFSMVKNVSEEQGLEGWVQEKIIKAADYLNTVREYLEQKSVDSIVGAHSGPEVVSSSDIEEDSSMFSGIRDKIESFLSKSGIDPELMKDYFRLSNMEFEKKYGLDKLMLEDPLDVAEGSRDNPDGSPKNVGLKAARKFGKEQDKKAAHHHFAKGAAKDDLNKFKNDKEQGVAEGSRDKVHLKTPKHGLADHPGRNTGIGLKTFAQTPEQNRCPKCNNLFKNHYQQSVAEGENKGLYYNVNKRKKAGTSRPASSPKAPTAQAWKDAAKTAKKV